VHDLPSECCLCREEKASTELCVCIRRDSSGKKHKGALCKSCIRGFLLEMSVTDPAEFDSFIKEAWLSNPIWQV
jgi:hypothetical protein